MANVGVTHASPEPVAPPIRSTMARPTLSQNQLGTNAVINVIGERRSEKCRSYGRRMRRPYVRTTARIASPYFSIFAGPIPCTNAKSFSFRGRMSAISRKVRSLPTT